MRKMPNKGRTEKNMKRIISVLLCALMIVAVMVIPATATTSYTFPKAAETFNLTDGKDPNGVSYTIATPETARSPFPSTSRTRRVPTP